MEEEIETPIEEELEEELEEEEETESEVEPESQPTVVRNESLKVKTMNFSLNTGEKALINYTTENINGEIKSIIISSPEPVDILIRLQEYPDVILYDVKQFIGTKYLPLQIEGISPDNQKLNFTSAEWYLDDALNVTVANNFNTLVKFRIIYC